MTVGTSGGGAGILFGRRDGTMKGGCGGRRDEVMEATFSLHIAPMSVTIIRDSSQNRNRYWRQAMLAFLLDAFQKYGPMLGFLGTIIGLIFGGYQVNQNTRIQRGLRISPPGPFTAVPPGLRKQDRCR